MKWGVHTWADHPASLNEHLAMDESMPDPDLIEFGMPAPDFANKIEREYREAERRRRNADTPR